MNTEQRRELAARVRELMEQNGWSAARLAQESGVAENTVSGFLSGKKQTHEPQIHRMLAALGVPDKPQDLLVIDEVPEDVRIFMTVAARRLAMLDADERNAILAKVYPYLLGLTS